MNIINIRERLINIKEFKLEPDKEGEHMAEESITDTEHLLKTQAELKEKIYTTDATVQAMRLESIQQHNGTVDAVKAAQQIAALQSKLVEVKKYTRLGLGILLLLLGS